jgi:hypothetical protein
VQHAGAVDVQDGVEAVPVPVEKVFRNVLTSFFSIGALKDHSTEIRDNASLFLHSPILGSVYVVYLLNVSPAHPIIKKLLDNADRNSKS